MFRAIDNFLNFIGASMRWLYGLMFQMVLLGENLTFDEFLNGSENKNDIVGKIGHRNANRLFAGAISEDAFTLKRVSLNNNTGIPPELRCQVTEHGGSSELKFEIRPNKLVCWAIGVVVIFLLVLVGNGATRINGQEGELTERILVAFGFLGLVVLIFTFLSFIGYRKAMNVLEEKLELRKT